MESQTFKQNAFSLNPTSYSWVYILYNSKTQEMNIGLSFFLSKQFKTIDTAAALVYYRSFSNPFDALAHKHLIEKLSIESIMHIIKQMNPTLRNLTSEIINP